MSFSQETYKGQGITQQNVVDQSGANLAKGIEAFGQGLAKFGKSKGEAVKMRGQLATFADDFGHLKPEGFEGSPKEWAKMFSSNLDDMGLRELQGLSENLLMKRSMQLYDAKIEQANLENADGRRQAGKTLADNKFGVNLLSGMDSKDAARDAAEGGIIGDNMFKFGLDQQSLSNTKDQAQLYGKGTGTDIPEGSNMITAQAITAQKNADRQHKLNQAKDENDKRRLKATFRSIDYAKDLQDAQIKKINNDYDLELKKYRSQGNMNDSQAKRAQGLWDGLQASKPVKDIGQLKSQYRGMENLLMSKENLEGPADIALVFTFMKTLDPTSVVREGEFRLAATAGGIIPKAIINQYNKIIDGSFLRPETRMNFLKSAREMAKGFVDSANAERDRYIEQGNQYGIPEQFSGGSKFSLGMRAFTNEKEALKAMNEGYIGKDEIFYMPGKNKKGEEVWKEFDFRDNQ